MRAHAILIAKTAALCITLGLALYFAFEAVASLPAKSFIALWLGLVMSCGLAAFSIPALVGAWRSGVLPSQTGRVERGRQPGWYWSLMALDAAANAGLIALAAYCALRLLRT